MNLIKIGIAIGVAKKLGSYMLARRAQMKTPPVRDDQQHVMSTDEKLDETIDESFPASDPPGHYATSPNDPNFQ